IDRLSKCSLIDIRNGPGLDTFDAMAHRDTDATKKFMTDLFEMLFVLDAGSADGIATGDRFGLYYEAEVVRDQDGRIVDRIPGSKDLVVATQVKERVTYCKLQSFAYEPAFDGMRVLWAN